MVQNPDQIARDRIHAQMLQSGWVIQDKGRLNLAAATGIAIREYSTDAGPADYILFVNKKPVGVIESKREEGVRLTMIEDQSTEYAGAKLKYINSDPLPFVHECAAELTCLTDYYNPKSFAATG